MPRPKQPSTPKPSSAKPRSSSKPRRTPDGEPPAPALPAESPAAPGLVERYHAMAEELNGRGAMELAVPFYRQTIALLLAEREQMRASADVSGVLAAAAQLAPEPALAPEELQRRITALEEELSPANTQEVAAALAALAEQCPAPSAPLLALQARVQLLAGDLAAARRLFEQAHQLEPHCPRLRLNTGAARLALGEATAALELLRPLAQQPELLAPWGSPASLWKNLAQAELQAGEAARALACLQQLLALDPALLQPDPWLAVAEQWLEAGELDSSRNLLLVLRPHAPAAPVQALMERLAEQLEAQGAYREAALLYRELLRPGLTP